MKAVRIHEFGGPDSVRVEDIGEPRLGPAEVALRVRAAALNHLDLDVREGRSRLPVALPLTLGFECVGTIEAMGDDVVGWTIGDRVMPYIRNPCGRCSRCRTGTEALCASASYIGGAFADVVVCPADVLLPAPPGLSDDAAAAFQTSFGTAWHMLFTRGKLRAGESVLVSSVGSGVGSAAVQLAHAAGAFVIGTASAESKLTRAAELGLDVGIDYTRQDIVDEVMRITGGAGVDLAFEHVGGSIFGSALRALAVGGRLVTCGGHGGEVAELDIISLFRAQKSILGSFSYTRDEFANCLSFSSQKQLCPVVHVTLPLIDAAAAMRVMDERRNFGKIVLAPV